MELNGDCPQECYRKKVLALFLTCCERVEPTLPKQLGNVGARPNGTLRSQRFGGAYDELYVDITGVPELWDRLEPLRYTST